MPYIEPCDLIYFRGLNNFNLRTLPINKRASLLHWNSFKRARNGMEGFFVLIDPNAPQNIKSSHSYEREN